MRSALILGYHQVRAAPPTDPIGRNLVVSAPNFRRHMEILARRFQIVPLHELLLRLAASSPAGGMAAVTFDDGYADNYEWAFPILSAMSIPATIFLATENIERGRSFWTERLAHHLCRNIGVSLSVPAQLGVRADLTSVERLRHAYRELVDRLGVMEDDARRESLLDALGGEDPPDARPLTWVQVRHMQRRGMAFGAHTRTHPSLPALSDAALREEIEESRDLIAARLAIRPAAFAYPFGHTDERVRRAVERAGFLGAVTDKPGRCAPSVPLSLLPRLMPADWDVSAFASHLDMFGTTSERARRFALMTKARISRRVATVVKLRRRTRCS